MIVDTSKLGSWKTTASGLVASAAGFVVAYPSAFAKWPWLVHLAAFIMAGGLLSIGISAKDSNVTGGTTPNPTNDPVAVTSTPIKKE